MPIPGRRGAPVDWLIVGLGNPGAEYAGTRHNVGFEVAGELATRWGLSKPKARYRGLISEGCTGPGGPRVAVLMPQTYMNEAQQAALEAATASLAELEEEHGGEEGFLGALDKIAKAEVSARLKEIKGDNDTKE